MWIAQDKNGKIYKFIKQPMVNDCNEWITRPREDYEFLGFFTSREDWQQSLINLENTRL